MYKIKAAMYENAFTDRRSPVGASSSEPTLQQQMADVIQKLQSDYDSLCAIERKKASDFEAKYSEQLSTVETQKLLLGDLERKTLDVVRQSPHALQHVHLHAPACALACARPAPPARERPFPSCYSHRGLSAAANYR